MELMGAIVSRMMQISFGLCLRVNSDDEIAAKVHLFINEPMHKLKSLQKCIFCGRTLKFRSFWAEIAALLQAFLKYLLFRMKIAALLQVSIRADAKKTTS
ncbi:hypothetical protein D1872_311350 [compost metagenome]